MTISGTTVQTAGASCNGATTNFTFTFHVDPDGYGATAAEDQIQVILETVATGAETILTKTTHYTVAINADQSSSPGGSITTVSTYSSAYKIWIRLNPDFTQQTDYQNQGGFLMETVEDQADQHTRQILWLKDAVRRTPRVGIQAGTSFDGEITGDLTSGYIPAIKSDLSGFQFVANNGSSTTVTSTGSTTGRLLADRFAEVINVKDYGAVGDGTTDDLAAFQAAYNALPDTGGIIYIPTSENAYCLSDVWEIGDGTSSVASTKQNVMVMGDTVPNGELSTNVHATRLKFTGANGSTAIIQVKGPITCAVIGLALDCNFLANSGLYATHAFRSRFQDLYVGKYDGSAYKLDSYNSHAQCTTGANNNIWDNIHCAEPGTTTCTAFEIGNAVKSAGTLGTSRNSITNFSFKCADNANSSGIVLRHCDIIHFSNGLVHCGVAATAANAKLLKIVPPTGSTTFPMAIHFDQVAILGDSVTNYSIDGSWTNDPDSDACVLFWPFMKADVESTSNPVPAADSRLRGITDEGRYFGAALMPHASDGIALGSTTFMWADVFIASGGVINFNAGDVTVTHSANALAFAGASSGYSFDANVASTVATASTYPATLKNTADNATVAGLRIEGDRATPGTGDVVYQSFVLSDSAGNQDEYVRLIARAADVTTTAEVGQLRISIMNAGSLSAVTAINAGSITPVSNDGQSLGTTGASFSDLFLAAGGVINWNSGNTTITQSANALAIAASSGVTCTGALTAMSGTAIPAGGTAGAGLKVSSTSNFGVFFGSGAPTLSAAKGSLYLRSDGSGTGDRAYINSDGGTTWVAITTAS